MSRSTPSNQQHPFAWLVARTGIYVCCLLMLFASLAQAAEVQVPVIKPEPQTQLSPQFLAPVTPVAYMVGLVIADPIGESPLKSSLQQAVLYNLSYLPFVNIIDSKSVPGGANMPVASGPTLDMARFRMARADNLITTVWVNAYQVEMRAYEVETGKFMFGTRLDTRNTPRIEDIADEFCAQFMEALTGRGDFFRATLAFSKAGGPTKKDIWIVRPTGRDLKQVTNVPGDAISPAWSHDGRFIIFSHIDERSHALGVWDSSTGRMQRLRFPGNTVIGPCFMPDNKVAVGLTDGQNPSIFLLNHSFRKEKKLISSWGIDVSPSVDSSGTKMVFTSSRQGNPHVFLEDLNTKKTVRVSQGGKYNTDPCISPDGTLVVYARQMGSGHRIFVHDLRTGREQQITFGPGSDEQPEFAPDSYFVAFTSTRAGKRQIYLTTRHGAEPKLIPTGKGDAAFPSWGFTNQKKK